MRPFRRVMLLMVVGWFVLAFMLIGLKAAVEVFFKQTRRFGGHYAVRMDPDGLVIWRYFTRWIVIDVSGLIAGAFCLCVLFLAPLAIAELSRRVAARKKVEPRGFEIIISPAESPDQVRGRDGALRDQDAP